MEKLNPIIHRTVRLQIMAALNELAPGSKMIALIIASWDWLSHGLISAEVLHPGKGPPRSSGRTFPENTSNKPLKIPVFGLAQGGALKSMTARYSAEDRLRISAIQRADFSFC
jgi:hypothetical protein